MPPLLESVTPQDLKRLLELFPVRLLRSRWPGIAGTKDEICQAASTSPNAAAEIFAFANDHLGCCRQHVYVFNKPDNFEQLPATLFGVGERVTAPERSSQLYLVRSGYEVVLRDPLEEQILHFLWPIRIDVWPTVLCARFVVLEKNLGSYFDRPFYVGRRLHDEDSLVEQLSSELGVAAVDLHAGVKALWAEDFMDSGRTKFKKANSTASEAMDEDLGIKQHNPELYQQVQELPLFNTLFETRPADGQEPMVFSVDPARGYVAFPRYTEEVGETDAIINEILQRNF